MELPSQLITANEELAAQGSRLRIEQRGQKLGLRGTLPCRDDRARQSVQRISLGLNADPKGFEEASQTARMVQRQLERGTFKWEDWRSQVIRPTASVAALAPESAIERFQQAFFADPRRRRSPAGSKTTWTGAYQPYLRRLQAHAGHRTIDANLLLKTLQSYDDGSRSRQQCATALAALARHLELVLPEGWRQEAGGYGLLAPSSDNYQRTARSWRLHFLFPIPAGGWPMG